MTVLSLRPPAAARPPRPLVAARRAAPAPRRHAPRASAAASEAKPLDSVDSPADPLWTPESRASADALSARFEAADVDGNGVIDRDELRAVLESTSSGLACTLTHWLTDADVDAVLAAYGGGAGAASLTRDQFAALAADGVLLAGTLDEYAAAFAAADAGGSGTVSATELADLLRSLGRPMSYDALVDAMARYDVDASGRLDFYEFLRMFRKEGLLALDELVDYVSLTPAPAPPGGGRAGGAPPHAKPVLREVSEIFSEAELDAALAARGPDGVTVLMASLTWCRPCRALARPLATLAAHYPDALFLKLYGNTDDETKRLFRDVLKVRSTPTFFIWRGTSLVHTHSGANKAKAEHAVRDAVAAAGGGGAAAVAALPPVLFPVEPKATGGW